MRITFTHKSNETDYIPPYYTSEPKTDINPTRNEIKIIDKNKNNNSDYDNELNAILEISDQD